MKRSFFYIIAIGISGLLFASKCFSGVASFPGFASSQMPKPKPCRDVRAGTAVLVDTTRRPSLAEHALGGGHSTRERKRKVGKKSKKYGNTKTQSRYNAMKQKSRR